MHSQSIDPAVLPGQPTAETSSGNLLQAAFDAMNSAPHGWILSGSDGSIHWANPVFLEMFGFADLSAVVGTNLTELFASERIRKMEDISRVIDQSRKGDAEFEVVGEDGRSFFVTVSESEVRNAAGNIVGRMAFFLDITQKKQIENELRNSHKYLRSLSARLVDAQETERKRVARELHDSIGASLSALKFRVEHWFDQQRRGAVDACAPPDKIVENMQQIIEEVRRISQNLHPSILDDLGLVTAVKSFCRQSQKNYPDLRVQTDIRLEEDSISERLQLVVYRVVQECLTNAARHGAAKNIRLGLRQEQAELVLDIEDDGSGFDPHAVAEAPSSTGMGLDNIRERTEIFGGRFLIDSQVGVGTVIQCRWPMLRQ
jgi:PAS domain S-box-containing protein